MKNIKIIDKMIDHPQHYGGENNTYEAIKVIEAWEANFNIGNVLKYLSRAGKKDPAKHLEDMKKAKWYLDREIANLESKDEPVNKKPMGWFYTDGVDHSTLAVYNLRKKECVICKSYNLTITSEKEICHDCGMCNIKKIVHHF